MNTIVAFPGACVTLAASTPNMWAMRAALLTAHPETPAPIEP